MHGWKHSTPRLPPVGDSAICNNADIDWYKMMPTNQLPDGPKVEMSLKPYEKEDAIMEKTFPD